MRVVKHYLAGISIAAMAGSLGSLRVLAADTAAASTELETITVTAEKRSESEQTVPLSMTTFSSAALQAKSINNFFDYATKVPNLAFAPTGDGVGTARTVSIRGISGDNVTGFYIDDTPLPDSLDPRVLDIDHIEVLRGPQGTLYGARSMGGVVRIITKAPNLNDFSAEVHGGISSTEHTNQPNYTGDGVVNIPLIPDHAALRLSGFYDTEAGYFKRSYCTDPAAAMAGTCTPLAATGITTVNNVGEINTYGGAASLTLKLNDALTITPRVMMQKDTYNGFPMADFLSMPGNGYGYPVPSGPYNLPQKGMLPTSLTQARFFNIPEGGYSSWQLYSIGLHWKTDLGELVSSTAFFNQQVWETEDQSDFIYAAITSNCDAGAVAAGFCSGVGSPQPGPISEEKSYQRFVQEVRFASDLKGPVQFVVGGFYSDFHGRLPFAAYYPPSEVPGLDATLGGQNNPTYPNLVFAQDFHTTIKEPAVFGEVSYQPVAALKLTAGLRWYQVKTSSSGYEAGLATGGVPGGLTPPIISPEVTTTESGVTPKFEADYHLTADQMIYVNVAKGFRPGGLVPIVPSGTAGTANDCVAALHQADPDITLADTRSYKSDSLWNYEVGTKTSWLDHRLTFNAAAFYIKWSNIQQQILLGCGFQYRANAGAAESKGGEMELHARPTQPLELSLGVGYQNAKITQKGMSSPQDAGSPVYQVPDWTGNASASYTTELTSSWNLVSGADYSYIGRSFSGNNDPSQPRERPSYRLINARFAFQHGPLEIALVGKNLADELANLGDNRSIAAEVPGRPRLFVNQPRTFGVEFRQSF
ncbi:MAG TPA: TonB-dependent receptor [Tepidisphaeraceae bacterium]|nr:TonB-dependent receptor [Tepidisphaeraceae bacterium]